MTQTATRYATLREMRADGWLTVHEARARGNKALDAADPGRPFIAARPDADIPRLDTLPRLSVVDGQAFGYGLWLMAYTSTDGTLHERRQLPTHCIALTDERTKSGQLGCYTAAIRREDLAAALAELGVTL